MSEWYDNYIKGIKEAAAKLQAPKKEIPQNILWLKSHLTERLETEKIEGVFTFRAEECKSVRKPHVDDNTFGYTEKMVNHMLTYAFNAGVHSVAADYKKSTKEMDEGLEKIQEILEDLGYTNENENY